MPSQADSGSPIPPDDGSIHEAAAQIGLVLPDACLPGVAMNLALLRDHAACLAAGEEG